MNNFISKKSNFLDELVCYSDSLHDTDLIKGSSIKFHVHDVLIQDIKKLIEQNNITICYTFRKGNQCAHLLFKLKTLSDIDLLIHPSPPDDILNLLKNDANFLLQILILCFCLSFLLSFYRFDYSLLRSIIIESFGKKYYQFFFTHLTFQYNIIITFFTYNSN